MIPALRAFRTALEDPQTISFIRTCFPLPEKSPHITSRKWLSEDASGYRWNIELLEKRILSLWKKNGLINVAHLEVDPSSGEILKRTYFANILMSEYKTYLTRLP
jgi:hypothetical protein